jgi:hypothetical protein
MLHRMGEKCSFAAGGPMLNELHTMARHAIIDENSQNPRGWNAIADPCMERNGIIFVGGCARSKNALWQTAEGR